MKKHSLNFCRDIAQSRNGSCLSEEYLDYGAKMTWSCEKNHKWNAPLRDILSGRWCRECAIEKRSFSIEDCKKFAKSKNGECLSSEYKNCNRNLLWKCEKDHTWNARFSSVKRGDWCKQCYFDSLRGDIKICQSKAKSKNLKCLSKVYTGMNDPMEWQCLKCNHCWTTTYQSIKSSKKQGCPACFSERNKKGNNLSVCKTYAIKQKGECLSTEYKEQYSKMQWKCHLGHIWKTTFKSVKNGRWCHKCAATKRRCKGENITREFLEKMFKKKFPSTFPSWLRNPKTNRKMEIDGFNSTLGIGFEYQGFQHYTFHKFIHGTKQKFLDLQIRDEAKVNIFKAKGLTLLIIKEFDTNWKPKKIEDYLRKTITEQLNLTPLKSKDTPV